MRARLFIITGVAVATVIGASSTAALAGPPKGPGGLGQSPTTTAPPPKGPDKVAPKPTTTTIPKGPGDIAPAPQDPGPQGPDDIADAPDDNGPKGPGDLADAPKGGGVEPGPDTTGNGSGSDNYNPSDSSDGNGAGTGEAAGTEVAGETVDAAAKSHDDAESSRVPAFLFIFFALLAAALIGFVAMRLRSEDEDVERV